MVEVQKTDPLASVLGDGYSTLAPPAKAAAAGSYLKSQDEMKKAASGEAGKRAEGQIISEFGPSLYSKPMEEFKPSQESLSGFAALGSLMMVAGGLFGSQGRLSGIGAMNNIAGMIKGYQQGRKDLYEQERQQFEENMKVQERNRADIKEAFDLALKMAPTNLRGAEEFMSKVFMSKGMNIPHEMMKTSGFTHTAGVMLGAIDKADNITKQIAESLGYKGVTSRKDLEARIAATAAGTAAQSAAKKEDVASQIQALDLKTKQQLADRGGLTVQEKETKERRRQVADYIVKNKIVPKTQEEMAAVAEFHPDYQAKPKTSGPGAFLENVLGEGATATFKSKDFDSVSGALEGIERVNKVQRMAKDPDIKFGVVPTFLQKVQQQVQATMQSFSPDRETALGQISNIINSIPTDPNDKNAVFQKESAFAALAIERAERGGSVLPVGFLDRIGPLLSPQTNDRSSYLSILESRKGELKSYLNTRYNISRKQTDDLTKNLFKMQFDPASVPETSKKRLFDDPKKYRGAFDAVYGDGAAALILGEE